MILAEWYGLSNVGLEEAVEFRIDFRKFVGLHWEDSAPDATTFCVFRKRIAKILPKLLKILNDQLKAAGFEVETVVAVDASLIEAHSRPVSGRVQHNGEDESEGRSGKLGDPDASWRGFNGKKVKGKDGKESIARRPAMYSYKLNASVSVGTGFIGKLTMCKGSEHETHHLMALMDNDTRGVFADKGYVGNKTHLKGTGIQNFIQNKASRNHPLSADQKKFNKLTVPHRRIVEAVFGSLKRWYGWHKTKYMGLARNTAAAHMTAIAFNIKKWDRYSQNPHKIPTPAAA